MERDRDSLSLEAEYLRAWNDDLQRLLGHIADVAQELAGVPISVLALVVAPPTPEGVERITRHALTALEHLALTQSCAIGLGELVGGRILAVSREAGLDDAPDE